MLQRPRATVVGFPPCARTIPAARLLAPTPARPRSITTTRSAPWTRAKYDAQPPTVPAPTTTRSARSLAIGPLSSQGTARAQRSRSVPLTFLDARSPTPQSALRHRGGRLRFRHRHRVAAVYLAAVPARAGRVVLPRRGDSRRRAGGAGGRPVARRLAGRADRAQRDDGGGTARGRGRLADVPASPFGRVARGREVRPGARLRGCSAPRGGAGWRCAPARGARGGFR